MRVMSRREMSPSSSGAAVLLLVVGVLAQSSCTGPSTSEPRGTHPELEALFARSWQFRLDEDPLLATFVGDNRANDRLPSVAPADLERRAAFDRRSLDELLALDWQSFSAEERINARIFERQVRDRIATYDFGDWQIPFNSDSGFHIGFARLAREVPLQTTEDYRNYTARLRAWPEYVEQHIANMRIGVARGMVLPRVVLVGYEGTIESHVVEQAEQSVFWAPFADFPSDIAESERQALRQAGRDAILEAVVPGYAALLDFFVSEYLPAARESVGASALPDGEAYYAQRVRFFTTLDISPQEVHALGLSEVERILAEMEETKDRSGFEGTLAEFIEFLRRDPRFYANSGDELIREAAYIAKTIDGKLPRLFKTLPRLPYTVEPVPSHMAPKYTGGRYVSPPENSLEPGIYWVNLYRPESRPLYTLTALTLHEAVPGHHLQHGIAREQREQPEFRRHDYISAFGEGWGLYAEWLGVEMGLYDDPYADFGRLTYEMWRACRLVVDTGLHAMGWSRQQAIDYLAAHTALSLHEVETETDRYISWPGQALAYKLGELKIKELRRRAEETLGSRFDVREFHDAVLANGSVPLPVLEELMMSTIERASRQSTEAL